MRTTVEIDDSQRAKLLELAAQRGEKGFSSLVREALELYLDQHAKRRDAVARALDARGALAGDDAVALEESVRDLRSRWR